MPKSKRTPSHTEWNSVLQNTPFSDEELDRVAKEFHVNTELRPIAKAPGYCVSACGRVFSRLPCSWRSAWAREMKHTISPFGYHYVRLQVNKKPSTDSIHRLVAYQFLPPPTSEQTCVRHLDGNPANNEVANLAWGTSKENAEDCVRHGRTLRGMKNFNAKLTPAKADIIRRLSEEGFSSAAVAHFFGVNRETIRKIVIGESYQ